MTGSSSITQQAQGETEAHGSESRRYAWLVVGLFWCVFFLNQADRQVIFSVFPLLKTELALSDAQLGAISSVFFWAYAVLVPIAGGLGDAFNRKWIIVGALLVWSAATFASGLTASLLALVTLRAFTAGGEALYYPAAASIMSDYHGGATRATALSVHQTANYFGVIVSGGLAGYIGQHYGWRAAFLSFGAAGIVVACIVAKSLREPRRSRDIRATAPEESLMERCLAVLRTPSLTLHTLAFLAMLIALTAYLTWMPTLLFRTFGLNLALAGLHATLWHHLGAMLGTLCGGKMADRLALRALVSRPLIQAGGLLAGAPFIYLSGRLHSLVPVLVSLALFGFCRGLYDSNLFASPYETIGPQARATATGLMLAVGFCGGGLGPTMVGQWSQRFDLASALSATAAFYVIGAVLLFIDAAWFFRKGAARVSRERTPA